MYKIQIGGVEHDWYAPMYISQEDSDSRAIERAKSVGGTRVSVRRGNAYHAIWGTAV